MELILSSDEGKFLAEVLEEHHRELLREISRASHHDFKLALKEKEKIIVAIINKLRTVELVRS